MPSALETLVKILKLEREQGCKNTAVIGGLAAFGEKWAGDAHAQARKPEHHMLVDELADLLGRYEQIDNRGDRTTTVSYMLDRIMGRVPPPPEYEARLHELAASRPPPSEAPEPSKREPRREERQRPPERKGEHDRSRSQAPGAQERGAEAQRGAEQPRGAEPQSGAESQPSAEQQSREAGAVQPRGAEPQRGHERGQGQRKDRSGQKPPRSNQSRQRAVSDDDDDGHDGGNSESSRLEFEVIGNSRGGAVQLDVPAPARLARPPRRPRLPVDPAEAADTMRGLEAKVEKARGVGPKMGQLLNNVGVQTIQDLLFYLPRRYDDYTSLGMISRLQPDMLATVIGTVRHAEVRTGRSGRRDFFMVVNDGSASMGVVFFSQFYLQQQIRIGQQVVLRGTTSAYSGRIQMVNPEWEFVDAEDLQHVGIVPVYPLTEGLNARGLRRLMKNVVNYWADRLPDYLPESVLDRAELAELGWTIRNLHFPEGFDHLRHAKRRYIFDQLLLLQLAILGNRRAWQAVPSESLYVSDEFLEAFARAVFPYELTGAQRRAIDDIRHDITLSLPMNRLLQGDVGSGKTAVALMAMIVAFANGKQAALMAPTSILAEQHYRNISRMLEQMPEELAGRRPVVGLLTSALTPGEREAIYRGLADGSIDLVIGTHAVIQEGVEFKNLALAIIDEQHRFGVEQRGALRGKGTNPHLLVMTATPIPRTLALTLYADLDLTVIDEMPPGRIPIQTRVLEPVARERTYEFVESQIQEGRQAFIVYPLVEASENVEAQSATEAYEHLQKVFHRYKVGLLHGRMKPADKDEVMAAFSEGKYDVLVTTSVAEVGVDIPNASVVVIDGANRFGLAQLHQFRGRVGRGGHASYCLLICDTNAPDARERLLALEQTTDGFKLAEFDWQLRGPGDLVGTRQSGRHLLQLVEEMSPELVALAQREARTLYEEDPELQADEHRLLAQRVAMLKDERSDVS